MKKLPEEWRVTTLGDVVKIKYGKDHKHLADGNYPLYGSGGIMRHVEKPLYTKPSVLIPRKGTLSNLFFVGEPFWSVDTIFYTEIDTDIVDPKYLFYKLKTMNLAGKNVGSAVPSLTTKVLNPIELNLPSLAEQKTIANILASIDDKIELLHSQNEILETIAQTVFKEWFVNFNYLGATSEMKDSELGEIPREWHVRRLGDVLEIRRGGSPRPIKDYIADSGYRWLKISDATATKSPFIFKIKEHIKKEGLNKTTLLKSGALILSNSATPGIPKFLEIDSCIHDGWLHFPKTDVFSHRYLYLFFKHIRAPLLQQGNGSVFKNLKTDILKNWIVSIPDGQTITKFDDLIQPIFEKIKHNSSQIQNLSKTRDTLLPKLMNGKVRAEGFGA